MSLMIPGHQPLTMSSREIADLVESRHDKVKQSIERLAAREVIGLPPLGEYLDSLGRKATEYRLDKRSSYIVVAQLSPEFTARLVDRWQELESQVAEYQPFTLDLRNPLQLSRVALQLIDINKELEGKIEVLEPKANAFDVLDASEGSLTIRETAKILGIPERKFIAWLMANDWAFRQNGIGSLQGYAEKRNAGYLEHKPNTYWDTKREEFRTNGQLMVTPKGLAKLGRIFSKQQALL